MSSVIFVLIRNLGLKMVIITITVFGCGDVVSVLPFALILTFGSWLGCRKRKIICQQPIFLFFSHARIYNSCAPFWN